METLTESAPALDYNKQPEWTQEEAIAYECACEAINDMIGICTGRIYAERRKANPDQEKIKVLDDERARLFQERELLDALDHKKVARIRSEYGAIIRNHRIGVKSAILAAQAA